MSSHCPLSCSSHAIGDHDAIFWCPSCQESIQPSEVGHITLIMVICKTCVHLAFDDVPLLVPKEETKQAFFEYNPTPRQRFIKLDFINKMHTYIKMQIRIRREANLKKAYRMTTTHFKFHSRYRKLMFVCNLNDHEINTLITGNIVANPLFFDLVQSRYKERERSKSF
jgi:hypothetical protein